jgi:glutaredoxin-related protein
MSRNILDSQFIEPEALSQITQFHSTIVKEVQDAVKNNKIVVVGMAQNPVVKKARKVLIQAGITFTYLEYGSYFKGWKSRLAIKIWSGWPTYPQVFVNGKLIGGCAETIKAIEEGKLRQV